MTTATRSRTKAPGWHPSVEEQLFGSIDPEAVLRRCGRTFYAASRVLPSRVRRDLAVLYAFCRAVDDCADQPSTPHRAGGGREALLVEIQSALEGQSSRSPIVSAFRELAEAKRVPLAHAYELIEGVRSDTGRVRMATSVDLVQYAYRVASTVGLMMCRILEVDQEGDPFAIDLGIGMQLTNIARDVAEDAFNHRVYLPAEWVDHDALLRYLTTDTTDRSAVSDVEAAVERLLRLADAYYDSAELGMHFLPTRVRGGIRSAAWNYRTIGTVIRRDPHAALHSRVSTRAMGKVVRTGAALWASVLESLPLGPADMHDTTLHTALAPLGVRPLAVSAPAGRTP
ncbi:MAG: phytoene/squalene synthase family protein [Planctomycetota bacterium]